MPSKTSKSRPSPRSPWKAARGSSEAEVIRLAEELAHELKAGDHVLLEGPLGAGKSTFARALLHALRVEQPPEGSPTFAIAHEYDSPAGEVVHVDFYRMRSEDEIEEAGITAYFWEREALVISEWISMWPAFEKTVLEAPTRTNWRVTLAFENGENVRPDRRDVTVEKIVGKLK